MNKTIKKSLSAAILSTISLVGISGIAEAATVLAGKDYVVTPENGAFFGFDFDNDNVVDASALFQGLPIGKPDYDDADTVAHRTQDVPEPGGTTPLEITELSLKSVNPVTVNGISKDIFVGLNPDVASTGTMEIRHDPGPDPQGGLWGSEFTINGRAVVADAGTLVPSGVDYIKGLINDCDTYGFDPSNDPYCHDFSKGPFKAPLAEPWTHEIIDPDKQIDGPESSNFFLSTTPIKHDAGEGVVHGVCTTACRLPNLVYGNNPADFVTDTDGVRGLIDTDIPPRPDLVPYSFVVNQDANDFQLEITNNDPTEVNEIRARINGTEVADSNKLTIGPINVNRGDHVAFTVDAITPPPLRPHDDLADFTALATNGTFLDPISGNEVTSLSVDLQSIPEPTTIISSLFGLGLIGWRKVKSAQK